MIFSSTFASERHGLMDEIDLLFMSGASCNLVCRKIEDHLEDKKYLFLQNIANTVDGT